MEPLDPPYPRLLVERYEHSFRFYDAVLPGLTGCILARGNSGSGYASWDAADGRTALALFTRSAMVSALGEDRVPRGGGSLVIHLASPDALDSAVSLCAEAGGVIAAPARDLPEWGPGLRAAHVLDPDGNLVELQTY
ncbi:glyoxalase/bleomycin resistance/extradiol dioxygenase family protein [Streptomyces sp. WM6378]|uniref:glyoxalase/bleomycin resistance/extradiol dioxygenase family protein n=1 Tax=Streptomyces sp. WM6378 TaxID=1415557 RepID=UPI000AD58503|nr:glyoxalase/bleomycin resistance/extradiol dioxygenase family protein [Streptomyces sp. WM6378]